MLSNPERVDVVKGQIRHAVTALLAQGHKLTKRTVAESAGCSATTVMKYRALWQATEISEETLPADEPLTLTPNNLPVWQELESKFAPMSIAARLVGCRYEQVTPAMAAFWRQQYWRLARISERYEQFGVTARMLRPYKDRVALLDEAALSRWTPREVDAAIAQRDHLLPLQQSLPANHRFLDLPFPEPIWQALADAMLTVHGQVFLEGDDANTS